MFVYDRKARLVQKKRGEFPLADKELENRKLDN
jgi:hypothetical protein